MTRRQFDCFWLLLVVPVLGAAADTLSDFRPSSIQSPHGRVSQVEFSSGLVVVEAGALAHHSHDGMKQLRFAEPVWVIGYRTEILDAQGKPPRENYLCHTFFGDQRVTQRDDQELKGIYSDSFTREVRLPEGFGLSLSPDDDLTWMPMFNNRGDHPTRVAMRVEVSLIRAKDLTRPLRPLYATLRSVQAPHLYFVPPGRHQKSAAFELPFDGKFHFLGTHIHPHGVSIELFNISRNQAVWTGRRVTDAAGRMTGMEVFSSGEGYQFRAGESYRLTAVYDNPTGNPIDAMAGLFLFYSKN